MNTIATELVDITKNIKWSFLGDANNTLTDFAPFERKIVPMKVQWADKVPTRSKKDALVQVTFDIKKHSDIPLVFSDGALLATIKELMEDIYWVPVINYSNHSFRVYVNETADWLTFKALKYVVKS